jgi:two-component system catabolic regulation response regulator CreB
MVNEHPEWQGGHASNPTSGQTTVLLVGPDQSLMREIALVLDPGYVVRTVATGRDARTALASEPVDLVVLDSALPDGDGLVMLADLKMAHPAQAIILLGTNRRAHDVVLGLRLGADDVVTRPLDVTEFRARLDAVLRRIKGGHPPRRQPERTPEMRLDGLQIDDDAGSAVLHGTALNLTRTEFSILSALVRGPGHMLSRKEIVDEVWAGRATPESRALDVHIGRLRRKMRSIRPDAPVIVSLRLQAYRILVADRDGAKSGQTADVALGGAAF